MQSQRLMPMLLAVAFWCMPLLSGCRDQHPVEKNKPSLQQQLGQEAAESIHKPLAAAQQAAELQEAANKKIQESAQEKP